MKKRFLLFSISLLALLSTVSKPSYSQDTASIMYYNILNFPFVEPTRADTLEKIFHYQKPDLLLVNELNTQSGGTDLLNNAINTYGINYYQMATFYDGPDSDNMLYYNSNKFGLKEQNQISTSLRDISEYIVYYKSADLATTNDTIFYYLYSLHLKASQGTTNENKRAAECQTLKDYLDNKSYKENVFVGGDFNIYTDQEPAYSTITNYKLKLYDPINRPGSWHNDGSFSDIHTQSTRSVQFSGGASGGMDDRFDFIFISNDIQTGDNNVKYIANSYETVGQDGNHFNDNLVNGTNNSAPDSVITALYYMSDHLPVYMKTLVGRTVDIKEHAFDQNTHWKFYFDNPKRALTFLNDKSGEEVQIKVVNIAGQKVFSAASSGSQKHLNLSRLKSGIYIAIATDGKSRTTYKFSVER